MTQTKNNMAAIDKNSMAASDKNNQNFNKNDKMHMKVIVNFVL